MLLRSKRYWTSDWWARGKDADLALLGADPTRDSVHLHALAGVVRDGRYFSPADVTHMREEIATRTKVD